MPLPRPPRNAASAASFDSDLTAEQVRRLCQITGYHAATVARQLRLQADEREDLRQDITLVVLRRLRWFDPMRGPFGGFVDLVAARAAARLAVRLTRTHTRRCLIFSDVTIPVHADGDENIRPFDAHGEIPSTDPCGVIELCLTVERSLRGAPQQIVETFSSITARSLHSDCLHPGSRATWYRRRRDLARWFLVHGIALPITDRRPTAAWLR